VPDTPAAHEGAQLPVDVWAGGEQAKRTFLVVGHLPIVTELVPPRGSAGERVTLRGYGFDPDPAGNRVRFGDREALVLSASATELVASAPARGPLLVRQAELAVTVEALGATSARTSFTMLGPPSGLFVPHFYAAPVPELPAGNHAFVSTELGPLMLLTGPAGPASPAQRAANVARVLNDLVDEAAKPLALSFEVEPTPSVALTGGHKVVVTATPRDVLGYEGLWAGKGKPGQANAAAVIVGRWQGTMEETGTGAQPVQARFFFEAGKLAGLLGRKSPKGVSAETRLRDVSYQDGDLAFALPAGGATLQFKASLREDVMAGVIHSTGRPRPGIVHAQLRRMIRAPRLPSRRPATRGGRARSRAVSRARKRSAPRRADRPAPPRA
jgi:hypothetical protein